MKIGVSSYCFSRLMKNGMSLEEAIEKALENRNEIHGAAFDVRHFELLQRETGHTTSLASAAYREATVALLAARYANLIAPKNVEFDVRVKYLDMIQKRSELELSKLSAANAKEAFRLASLQYDAGMTTLADTNSAQLSVYRAELGYNMTLLAYNLAIVDYELSSTVGISTIRL